MHEDIIGGGDVDDLTSCSECGDRLNAQTISYAEPGKCRDCSGGGK